MNAAASKLFGFLLISLLGFAGQAQSETIQGEVRMINQDQNMIHILSSRAGAQPQRMSLKIADDATFTGVHSLSQIEVGDSIQVEVEDRLVGPQEVTRLEMQQMGAGGGGQYTWGDKLSRGVVNFFTSPVEIPRQIDQVGGEAGAGQAWTVGLVQGLGRTLLRAGAGLLEVVTFPFDFPNEQKAPIMQPAYAWQNWPPDTV